MSEEKDLKLSDLVKRAVSTGLGAAFMAEDAIKSKLQDLPVPKDVIEGLVKNAKSTKEEFVGTLKTEVKNFLNRVDITKEIDRVLENYDLDISANISFKKKKEKNQD